MLLRKGFLMKIMLLFPLIQWIKMINGRNIIKRLKEGDKMITITKNDLNNQLKSKYFIVILSSEENLINV